MVGTNTININNYIINRELLECMLSAYNFTAEKTVSEEDGLVILCLDEIEFLIAWGADEDEALNDMAKQIFEYAEDYYNYFETWSKGTNTVKHIPYVLKALILNDVEKIKELIKCRLGEI